MEREKIKSSNIESVGYDNSASELEIEFKGGFVYKYFGVEEEIWHELKKAESKGSFFHKFVKNKYEWKKQEKEIV